MSRRNIGSRITSSTIAAVPWGPLSGNAFAPSAARRSRARTPVTPRKADSAEAGFVRFVFERLLVADGIESLCGKQAVRRRLAPPARRRDLLGAIDEIPLERIGRLVAVDGLARQHLPQFHPAVVEGVGGSRHVDAPDAVFLFADKAAGFVGMRLQPG